MSLAIYIIARYHDHFGNEFDLEWPFFFPQSRAAAAADPTDANPSAADVFPFTQIRSPADK